MVKARNIVFGDQVVKFTCPTCGQEYAAPIYTKDFVCKNCYIKEYEWNYVTNSKEYKISKDTFIEIQ